MKISRFIFILLVCCFLVGCQSEEIQQIEIQKHVFVEREFEDSWLEKCDDNRTYLQLVLDGGYDYQTNKDYLDIFYKNGGKIELYNYSIKKDHMIISGEFIADSTIRLMHPNLDGIESEGVLMHELGHFFDYQYHFSNSKKFKKLYDIYYNEDVDKGMNGINTVNESEFFAELFKEYTAHLENRIPHDLEVYMSQVCQKILEN